MIKLHSLEKKIQNKTATVGVIGLGYVGLPLAMSFKKAEFSTIGFDINSARVDSVNSGEHLISYIDQQDFKSAIVSNDYYATGVNRPGFAGGCLV